MRARTMLRYALSGAALLAICGQAAPAFAGGYDTPILYSARHQAMGGTAIGYVRDPSALFHNPAGLGHTKTGAILADFSLLTGRIKSRPDAAVPAGESIWSERTVAPFFLLGGSYRVWDMITVGLGVFPVASAGASYEYDNAAGPVEDSTRLVFFEVTPAVAVNLPFDLNLGFGYRVNIVQLDRTKGAKGDPTFFKVDAIGASYESFRVGLQWSPSPLFRFGFNYRHKAETEIEGDSGFFVGSELSKSKLTFTLPAQIGLGFRGDFEDWNFGWAFDAQYTLNSQNDEAPIFATRASDGQQLNPIANISRWTDAWTLRLGFEYRFLDNFSARTGWVWDEKTSNKEYPTAFGTPPAPTNSWTVGGGYDAGPWEVNLAYAYRFGSTTINPDVRGEDLCIPCSQPDGDYEIVLHGVYVDFSYDFGEGAETAKN